MAKKRYKFGGEWIEVDETPGEGKTKKFTARATGEKYSEPQKTSIGVAPSITKQYQTLERENERKLTGRERENNRLYSAYESEIKGELSRAAVRNPLVASEIIRADERQRKESAQRMGETAAVTSYLRSEQSKIPYTQVSDAGKLVKTGDAVKVIKPGEENLHQGDAPALGGPMESGSETAGKRYAESIRPFFENEDYLSDGDLLFEKYGEDAIPLIENALADWKENKRLHPERVQAGAEITEQADNFERQLRRTLAALREIRYTANRGNEDFSKLAAQGAQMDSPAATARERLTSDNKFTAGVGLMLGDHRYAAMTEEERQLYNYLLAKEGEQSAQEYLNTIEDRLNARFGKAFHDTAENLENPLQRAGITAVTSVGAGVHDFGTGVHQSFTDEPVARAPLQYAADLYSSELGGVSKFAFDTGRTIGNMAPALAASAALGGLGVPAAAGAVSSAMTGLSSAGNSYREAIEQGYLPEEARQYATMSGLSEFGTTYLLSGISKFGGKLTGNAAKAASERVTNGALRFAFDTGIKMGGEGIEEVLQNELDLFFRNMVLGEDNDLNPLTEENAYTFLMAAATAGLLEGPGSAVNAWNGSQLTQAGRAVEESGNLNTLLNRSLAGSPELRDAAGRVLYSEGTERLMAAGELLLRYAEETGDAGLILRTPERNEALSLPRQEAVFADESRQKYGTKTGENFVALPVFKDGKPVEDYWETAEPVKVGRGTVIQRPYTGGNTPKNVDVQQKNAPVVIDSGTVEKAAAEIAKAQMDGKTVRGTIRRAFNQVFDSMGGQRKVQLDRVTFKNRSYDVSLNKNLVGKVISDPHLSPEKLSVLYQLDDAVKGAEYVGSGTYGKDKSKAQNVIRYDYFENEVEIGGEPYLMTFDVEVYHGSNNMRTYRTIKEIDLTPVEGNVTPSKADAASHGLRTHGLTPEKSSLFSDTNIPQSESGVNTQSMREKNGVSTTRRGNIFAPVFQPDGTVTNLGDPVDMAIRSGYSEDIGGGSNGQGLGNRSDQTGRVDARYVREESGGGRGTEAGAYAGGGEGVSRANSTSSDSSGQIQNTGETREVRASYPDAEVTYHSPALSDTAEPTRALAQRFAARGINAEIFDGDLAEIRNGQRIVHHGRAMTLPDGTVVIRDGTENLDEVLQHELIHHGARTGAPEAARVIDAVRESGLNLKDQDARENLEILTKRYERNGKQLDSLENESRLFEELASTVAGFHRLDPEGTRRAFGALFNDYDGIISAIEEAYPELNTRGSGETPAVFSSARNERGSNGLFAPVFHPDGTVTNLGESGTPDKGDESGPNRLVLKRENGGSSFVPLPIFDGRNTAGTQPQSFWENPAETRRPGETEISPSTEISTKSDREIEENKSTDRKRFAAATQRIAAQPVSLEEKVRRIQREYQSLGSRKDVLAPLGASYVLEITKNGKIDYSWPPRLGFAAGERALGRENRLPGMLDRVGGPTGNSFSTMRDGKVYTNSERAIPYLENREAYHVWEVNGDSYFEKIDRIRSGDLEGLNAILREEGLAEINAKGMRRLQMNYKYYLRQVEGLMGAGYEARYGIGGKAAAWGNLKGGADQFTLPLNVKDMRKIGVLRGRSKK